MLIQKLKRSGGGIAFWGADRRGGRRCVSADVGNDVSMSTHDEENVFRADCCVIKSSRNRFDGLLRSNSARFLLFAIFQ